MVAAEARPKRHDHVEALIHEMRLRDVAPEDPTLLSLLMAYRQRFGLGVDLDLTEHVATTWKAVYFRGRIVAVFGQRAKQNGRVLEVTDGYCEDSRYGWVAFYSVAIGYTSAVDSGAFDLLTFTVLYRNERMWRGVLRETKRFPWALMFAYGKAAA